MGANWHQQRQPTPTACTPQFTNLLQHGKAAVPGAPNASSAGTGLTPGMLVAVLLPPCAEEVLEAAAPRAARPRSSSAKAMPQRARGRNWELHQTPRKAGPYGHRATPSTSSWVRAGGPAHALPERFSRPSAAAGLGWDHSSGTAILRCAARCRTKSGPQGRGRICLASGLVRQCQRQVRRETSPTCRPALPLPVSQLLQAQRAKYLPLLPAGHPSQALRNAGQGQQEPRLLRDIWESGSRWGLALGESSIPGTQGSSLLSRLLAHPRPPFCTVCLPRACLHLSCPRLRAVRASQGWERRVCAVMSNPSKNPLMRPG